MAQTDIISADSFDFKHIGWKYYNQIRKKVMDKSSVSGLVVSLSIAFFIVIFAASFLRVCYLSIEQSGAEQKFIQERIYQLEVFDSSSHNQYLQPTNLNKNKIENISSIYLA